MIITTPSFPLERIDDLLNILERHQNNTDPLSIRIFRWGAGFLEATNQKTVEQIVQIAQERLQVLKSKILVNPIDKAPLQDPVVERTWVWERWMHSDYRSLFKFSPLDGGEMFEFPSPHYFAQQMLGWFVTADPEGHQRDILFASQTQMVALARNPVQEEQRRWLYQRLAQAAVWREQTRQVKEDIEWGIVEANVQLHNIEATTALVIEKAEEKAQEAEKKLIKQIKTIEEVYNESLNELQKHIEWENATHQKELDALQERIANTDKSNYTILTSLNAQVQSLNKEHRKTVCSFESRIITICETHKANMANVEGQLSSLAKAHHSALSSITHLENHSAQIHKKLEKAAQDEKEARLNNERLGQDLNNLKQSYNIAQWTILNLRWEVENMDEPMCIIS